MVPRGFKIKEKSNAFVLEGKILPIIPGLKPIPCRIVRTLYTSEIRVFLRASRKRVPWVPIREEFPGNWLWVDLGDDVKNEVEALFKVEALINKSSITKPQPKVTRVQPGKREKEREVVPIRSKETLRYRWDGLLLLEVADYVNWSKENKEQICYVAGLKHNETYIPTRFYRVKGERSALHVHVDPVSQAEILDIIYNNGLIFLGSCHSQPDTVTQPSSVDLETMRRFQKHYPCFGCVITPSGRVHFYSPTRPIHVTIQHPKIKEVKDGQIFQIQGPK